MAFEESSNIISNNAGNNNNSNNNNSNSNVRNNQCCAGCREPIKDRFIFSVIDLRWHQDCVQCTDCSLKLNERCYEIEGKLYCKLDYWRRFGPKCFACRESIDRSELVQRIRGNQVYHLKCFTCNDCHKQLKAGEQMHLVDGKKLLCKQDYNQFAASVGLLDVDESSLNDGRSSSSVDQVSSVEGATAANSLQEHNNNQINAISSNVNTSGTGNNSLTKTSHTATNGDDPLKDCANVQSLDCLGDDSLKDGTNLGLDCAGDDLIDANGKRRGPRTTIKPKQLETLRRAFESAPKPSRHIREQLAAETGLNMRVIQMREFAASIGGDNSYKFSKSNGETSVLGLSKFSRMGSHTDTGFAVFMNNIGVKICAGSNPSGAPPPTGALLIGGLRLAAWTQVWFQNRRSKERRMKNSNGSARRNFFRSSRRLRVGPTEGATPTANGTPVAGPQSLIAAGNRALGKKQASNNQQLQQQQQSPMDPSDQTHQQQTTNQPSGQATQQAGIGRGQQNHSPSEFGGSSSGGFTYFSDSSNQGDAFAINTSNQQPGGQQTQYMTNGSNQDHQAGTMMALGSPSQGTNQGQVGAATPSRSQAQSQQQQQPQQQQQQQQSQQPQYQPMKHTPPPAPLYQGGPPPPPPQHMIMAHHSGPHAHPHHQHQHQHPHPPGGHPPPPPQHQHMVGPGPMMQPSPGMGNLLGHPQGPSVVQW